MNLENMPTAVFLRWGMVGLNDLAGLIPVTAVLGFLIVFRPPPIRFTDADLDALLGRT